MTTPVLEARGLVKRYGHVTALGGVDFDIRAGEVVAVIGDNEKVLAPALAKLDRVSGILQRNGAHIDETLRLLGPYYTMLTDATGSGPWVDGYPCGLFTEIDGVQRPHLDPDQPRNCHPEGGGGR